MSKKFLTASILSFLVMYLASMPMSFAMEPEDPYGEGTNKIRKAMSSMKKNKTFLKDDELLNAGIKLLIDFFEISHDDDSEKYLCSYGSDLVKDSVEKNYFPGCLDAYNSGRELLKYLGGKESQNAIKCLFEDGVSLSEKKGWTHESPTFVMGRWLIEDAASYKGESAEKAKKYLRKYTNPIFDAPWLRNLKEYSKTASTVCEAFKGFFGLVHLGIEGVNSYYPGTVPQTLSCNFKKLSLCAEAAEGVSKSSYGLSQGCITGDKRKFGFMVLAGLTSTANATTNIYKIFKHEERIKDWDEICNNNLVLEQDWKQLLTQQKDRLDKLEEIVDTKIAKLHELAGKGSDNTEEYNVVHDEFTRLNLYREQLLNDIKYYKSKIKENASSLRSIKSYRLNTIDDLDYFIKNNPMYDSWNAFSTALYAGYQNYDGFREKNYQSMICTGVNVFTPLLQSYYPQLRYFNFLIFSKVVFEKFMDFSEYLNDKYKPKKPDGLFIADKPQEEDSSPENPYAKNYYNRGILGLYVYFHRRFPYIKRFKFAPIDQPD